MEKVRQREIRDYLHLYLGCDYQWQDESGEWRRALRLNSYQLNDVIRHHLGARLILRPLSDMTDDEISEYGKLDRYFNRTTGENAEKFRYLLSKGFDLFGLIDEGLAVDKTTLSQGEIKTELI